MERAKQPKGLYLLFFTELWERFGFYTLQTIIILYMTQALMLSDSRAYLLYGTFSSMLYLTPVIGGYLADRYLGYQRAIIIGGVLLVLGYTLTAIPDPHFFFLGFRIFFFTPKKKFKLIYAKKRFSKNVLSTVLFGVEVHKRHRLLSRPCFRGPV